MFIATGFQFSAETFSFQGLRFVLFAFFTTRGAFLFVGAVSKRALF